MLDLKLVREDPERVKASLAKRGPGVAKCDVLVINKFDLAPYVGVDLDRMMAEARDVRSGRPVMLTNCRTGEGVDAIVEHLSREVLLAG